MAEKDFIALLLVILLSAALFASSDWIPHFLTESSYENALDVKENMGSFLGGGVFYAVTGFAYSSAAGLAGVQGFDLGLFLLTMRMMAPLFGALFAAGLYISLRGVFNTEASFAGAVLAATSTAALGVFMANIFLPAAMSAAMLSLGTASLFYGIRKRQALCGVVAGAFIGLAVNVWAYALLCFAGLVAALLVQIALDFKRNPKKKEFLTASVLCVISAFLFVMVAGFGEFELEINVSSGLQAVLLMAPLFVIVAISLLLRLMDRIELSVRGDGFAYAALAMGLLVSSFSPLASLPLVAFGAAFGSAALFDMRSSRNLMLFAIGLVAALVSFILMSGFMTFTESAFFSLLIGAAGAFGVSMFESPASKRVTPLLVVGFLLFTSFNVAAIGAHYQADPVDVETQEAIAWLRSGTSSTSVLAVAVNSDMVELLSERTVVKNTTLVKDYLLSNASTALLKEEGAGYLVVDASIWDYLEEAKQETGRTSVRMESFGFIQYQSDGETVYGVFASTSGNAVLAPLDPATMQYDVLGDVFLYDSSGNMRKVSFGKFLEIKDKESRTYRLVYPYENYQVNLFNAFFGKVNGLEQAYPQKSGRVRVYKVE